MATIIQVLCLLGVALAAEDNSSRKARQILAPFGAPSSYAHPHAHLLDHFHGPQVVGPSVHYLQPAVPALALTHPVQIIPSASGVQGSQQISSGFPQQQSALQRALGYVQSSLQSAGRPSASFGSQSGNTQNTQSGSASQNGQQGSSQANSASFQPNFLQASSSQSNDFSAQSSANSGNQGNQFSTSFSSPRISNPRPITANDNSINSQPLITPTQSTQQNQLQNSGSFNQQNPSQTSNSQSGSSFFSQSPQQFDSQRPQQSSLSQSLQTFDASRLQFGSQSSSQLGANSQGSSAIQQQTQAFFPTTQYRTPSYQQQGSNGVEQSAAILSQTGQIGYDGSYSYGFQSDNGIQSSQVGLMRNVGPYSVPVVHGSYSYTAPDGTPVSASYYADHTGFHVHGSHVPSPNLQGNGLADPSGPGQQQGNLPVSVESN